MARTRSKPAKPARKESTPEPTPATAKSLPPSTSNPPKLFVLPKDTSNLARIVTLNNPATGNPSRYYFCPQKGFYEFTRISVPKRDCRSWLITGSASEDAQDEKKEGMRIGSGYVTQAADMFLATPIDIVFLILPALAPQSAKDTRQHFLALDDYLDLLSASSRHWKALLAQHHLVLKTMIEKRICRLCDSVDAGGESMYRVSNEKIASMLLRKAERMVKTGLPKSLEDKFVKSALEVPVMNIPRENSTLSILSTTSKGTENAESQPQLESQSSLSTSTDSQSTTATSITTPDTDALCCQPALTTPPGIPNLLRTRTALTYLTSCYVPKTLLVPIQALTAPTFTSLDTHLTTIAKLKAEAAALRSISDNISRKRAIEEDEDKIAEREEKKRRKDEEDKKKKMEGRAIKQLKKADTSGMKKMSSFFQKVPKKA